MNEEPSEEQLLKEYISGNPTYKRFTEELSKTGYDVTPYNGRYEYHGPSIVTDDVDRVMSIAAEAGIACAKDEFGKKFVVYPITKKDWEHANMIFKELESLYPGLDHSHMAVYPDHSPKE
jgi:hypothetical protein